MAAAGGYPADDMYAHAAAAYLQDYGAHAAAGFGHGEALELAGHQALPDLQLAVEEPANAAVYQPRRIGMCKSRNPSYVETMQAKKRKRDETLAAGQVEGRPNTQAFRAAQTRSRVTNHNGTLTEFAVRIGTLMQHAADSGEDVTTQVRDAYLQTMTALTQPLGRVLPSNRSVNPALMALHNQIAELISTDQIQCQSGSDPALTDPAPVTVQLVGNGPVRAPMAMLPMLHSPLHYEPEDAELAYLQALTPSRQLPPFSPELPSFDLPPGMPPLPPVLLRVEPVRVEPVHGALRALPKPAAVGYSPAVPAVVHQPVGQAQFATATAMLLGLQDDFDFDSEWD